MGDARSTHREARTELRKTIRGIDGTDLNDRIGNAGDEISKDLGNLGDRVRKADHGSKADKTDSESKET